MKTLFFSLFIIFVSCTSEKMSVLETGSANPMPREWIDRDTGHKIIQLVKREEDNRSLYFHNDSFLPAVESVNEKIFFNGKIGKHKTS